jgi:radical SAM superfamily enzyme YgiQ (UPF0313 family)
MYSADGGDKDTLDRIKKALDIAHFNQIVKETSDIGVVVKVALIFGFPGQTKREVANTFLLLNKLVWMGARDISCLSFVPYPKTELFEQLGLDYDYNSIDNNIRLNNDIPNMKSWSIHFSDSSLKFIIVFYTIYFYALQGLLYPHRVAGGFYRVFINKRPMTNFESLFYLLFNKKKASELPVEDMSVI